MKLREGKIKNRSFKEKIRKGTKLLKDVNFVLEEKKELRKFLNKIICGDAEKVLKKISENSIDIIITSPPYNFGQSYADDSREDTREWNEYFYKLNKIWRECFRIIKPGGRICINIQPLFSDYVPTHHIISAQLLKMGFLWKAEILWDKSTYNAKYTSWGSWCSPSMPYLKYTWEFIEVFSKISHKKEGERENIDIHPDEFKKWVFAKWNIAPETRMREFKHPAVFPEELPLRLLKLFSYKNDIVLDPFNGAGTTSLVALKLGRRFIGIDISEEYCKTALKRIENFLSQRQIFGDEEVKPELLLKV